jgi:thermitase
MKRLIVFILALAIFLSLPSSVGDIVAADTNSSRAIVKFRTFIPSFFKNRLVEKYGGNIAENLELKNTFVVKVPKEKESELINSLSRSFIVEYAEGDPLAKSLDTPNDEYFDDQWSLKKIQAEDAWTLSKGSGEVDIAIVDSGVNTNHQDLKDKITASVDCTLSGCPYTSTSDPYGHGTHVAGIASAVTNNSEGVAGVSWENNILSVKVLNDSGSGYYSWIANGIVWATDNGAEIINLSLGGRFSSYTLSKAVDYAWDKGVVIVAAAGNEGSFFPMYPAYYPEVIAVAATDQNDSKASFSNYGSWVDVAAPGVSILSTFKGGYGYLSGTSMATPHVAGVAALIKGIHPLWNNQQVKGKIENSTDSLAQGGWNFGRINACEAVDCTPGVDVSPTPTSVPTNTSTPTNTPTSTLTPFPTTTPSESMTPTNTPTPTPSPLPTLTNTPTPSLTSTSTPTPTPIPSNTLTPSPTPSPTPTQSLPWWCVYVPWHYTCNP